MFTASAAYAHGVAEGDAEFIQRISGVAFMPYVYLGAKHMFTGYDHLLFLAGVIFFLYRMKDVALYVSLFAVGHSVTLLLGVLGGIRADASIVDAIIGLSVVYKAFENMGGFQRLGITINTRHAVFLFGLAHGFGLSTKLQDFTISSDGLVPNMLAFNIGVELGQLAALTIMLLLFQFWRVSRLERLVRRHARSIAHMDAWADVMDERMERVDWIKMHQSAANDRRRKVRKAG